MARWRSKRGSAGLSMISGIGRGGVLAAELGALEIAHLGEKLRETTETEPVGAGRSGGGKVAKGKIGEGASYQWLAAQVLELGELDSQEPAQDAIGARFGETGQCLAIEIPGFAEHAQLVKDTSDFPEQERNPGFLSLGNRFAGSPQRTQPSIDRRSGLSSGAGTAGRAVEQPYLGRWSSGQIRWRPHPVF